MPSSGAQRLTMRPPTIQPTERGRLDHLVQTGLLSFCDRRSFCKPLLGCSSSRPFAKKQTRNPSACSGIGGVNSATVSPRLSCKSLRSLVLVKYPPENRRGCANVRWSLPLMMKCSNVELVDQSYWHWKDERSSSTELMIWNRTGYCFSSCMPSLYTNLQNVSGMTAQNS